MPHYSRKPTPARGACQLKTTRTHGVGHDDPMSPTRTCLVVCLCWLAVGCSRSSLQDDVRTEELAESLAEAEAAGSVSFAGGELPACGLLTREEVETVLGPLVVAPFATGEQGPQRGGDRCGYRTADGRLLIVGGSTGDASSRLEELDGGPVPVEGEWEEAGMAGCCVLNAVRDDALVTVDATAAKLDVARIGALMSRALSRVKMPLGFDADAGVAAALALDGVEAAAR